MIFYLRRSRPDITIKASKPLIQNDQQLMTAFRINVTQTVSRGTPGWFPRETFRGYASTIFFFIIELVNINLIPGFHRALLQSITFIGRLSALDYTKLGG